MKAGTLGSFLWCICGGGSIGYGLCGLVFGILLSPTSVGGLAVSAGFFWMLVVLFILAGWSMAVL